MTKEQAAQAAANKFLTLNSGNLAAYLESCVKCGNCATAWATRFWTLTEAMSASVPTLIWPWAKPSASSRSLSLGDLRI